MNALIAEFRSLHCSPKSRPIREIKNFTGLDERLSSCIVEKKSKYPGGGALLLWNRCAGWKKVYNLANTYTKRCDKCVFLSGGLHDFGDGFGGVGQGCPFLRSQFHVDDTHDSASADDAGNTQADVMNAVFALEQRRDGQNAVLIPPG